VGKHLVIKGEGTQKGERGREARKKSEGAGKLSLSKEILTRRTEKVSGGGRTSETTSERARSKAIMRKWQGASQVKQGTEYQGLESLKKRTAEGEKRLGTTR